MLALVHRLRGQAMLAQVQWPYERRRATRAPSQPPSQPQATSNTCHPMLSSGGVTACLSSIARLNPANHQATVSGDVRHPLAKAARAAIQPTMENATTL